MTDPWVVAQFTVGNIVVLVTMVANLGWQMRRLVAIETKLLELEEKQNADRVAHDKTYQRRDVMEMALQGIYTELRAIAAAQSELRVELRDQRHRGTHG